MKRYTIHAGLAVLAILLLASCNPFDCSGSGDDLGYYRFHFSATCYDDTTGSAGVIVFEESDSVETIRLFVDGIEMPVEEQFGEYVYTYSFHAVPGETIDYRILFNDERQYSATLEMPYIPSVDFPETWDGQTDELLTWELERNTQSQFFWVFGPDDDNTGAYYYLTPSERQFAMSAGFHGYEGLEDQTLRLYLYNQNVTYIFDNPFIAYSRIHRRYKQEESSSSEDDFMEMYDFHQRMMGQMLEAMQPR